jgi:hypothetical protein
MAFSVCESLREERWTIKALQAMLSAIIATPRRLSAFRTRDEIFVIDVRSRDQEAVLAWRAGFVMGHCSESDEDWHVIPFVDTAGRIEGGVPVGRRFTRHFFAHQHVLMSTASVASSA